MDSALLKFKDAVTCSAKQDGLVAFGVKKDILVYDLFELKQGSEIAMMTFKEDVYSIAISPCGMFVVAGLGSGLVEMRSLVDAGFKRGFQGHCDRVRRVLFSLCESFLISGSWDCTVKIWNSATGVCQAMVDCGSNVCGLTLLPRGREIIAGTYHGMIFVFGMDGVKRREVDIEGGKVTTLACADDAVVVALSDGRLQLRGAARLDNVIWSSWVHRQWIYDVCVSPSDTEIAMAYNDNTLAVVSFATGETLRDLREHTNYVATALFTPDGFKVITGSADKTVRVCHLYLEAQKCITALLTCFTSGSITLSDETIRLFADGLKRILFR